MKHEFQKVLEAELTRLNMIVKAELQCRNTMLKLGKTSSRNDIEQIDARISVINLTRASIRQAISLYKKNM